ncbi:MAG: type II secretion system F family protein [Clostridium sp.]|nr:type II secretion system F family protein [Clostridium sp.]MCM1444018.1 type II secretion system F family protein [Candidatus Amulumruptor caecigallinarius]
MTNLLSKIVNIIKYPFIGLFFTLYIIVYVIYLLFKYLILGIIFIIYAPFKLISGLLKPKENIPKTKPEKISSSKRKQDVIEIRNQKKLQKIEKQQLRKQQKAMLFEKKKQEKELDKVNRLTNDPKFAKKQAAKEAKKQAKLEKENLIKQKLLNKAKSDIKKDETREEKALRLLQEREEKKKEKERIRKLKKEAKQKVLEKSKQDILEDPKLAKYAGKPFGKLIQKIYTLPFVRRARNKRDINRQALMLEFDNKSTKKNETKVVYIYEAKNPEGKIVREKFAAYSKVEVHSFLLSEGYEVYSIKTNPLIQILFKENATVKFKTKDLIFFLTQLSTYIKAGITLVEALKVLSRQYKQRKYKDIFRGLIYDLSTGESFSNAMLKQESTFPKLLINMVKAAELTGELTEALDDMADYYSEVNKTRKQMINAMTYPAIVLFISIAVLTFIMVYVIPKFVDMYEAIDPSKIPGFTIVIMNISNFLQTNILYIGIILVVVIIAFILLYKKVKVFRTTIQWILMHIPVIGNVIIYNEVSMFTKTFASLLAHNVYITDSMEILQKLTNNEIYQSIILETVTNLAKGEKISSAFKDHWAFPIPAYEMLVTGESTGQLAEMMQKVSIYYQELHKDIVTKIKTLLEPALIIILTVMVGIIVLSVVVPMFSLYNAIQEM